PEPVQPAPVVVGVAHELALSAGPEDDSQAPRGEGLVARPPRRQEGEPPRRTRGLQRTAYTLTRLLVQVAERRRLEDHRQAVARAPLEHVRQELGEIAPDEHRR